jgi:hypothetical protein
MWRARSPRRIAVASYPRSPSTQSGRRRGRPRPPCSGGIASTNARASCESFRFAPVRRTASGTPRHRRSDDVWSRAWPDRWGSVRSGHRRTPRGLKNCPRSRAANQSARSARANPVAQSGSNPTHPPVASRAGAASTSSPIRTRVPPGASARECRCEGRRRCRSSTRDPRRAAVRLLVDGVESARTVGRDSTRHLEAAQRPYPVHPTSPTRIRLRRFCYSL